MAVLALAAVGAAAIAAPAFAQDKPKPSLSLEPVVARSLLAPVDSLPRDVSSYRLDPGRDPAAGQRAKLSVDFGDATLFAITGRLSRQSVAEGPLDPGHAQVLGRRSDGGKVYGAGVARTVRGVDLSATYQYSKATAGQPMAESEARDGGPGKSHSVRATARIRFTP